MPDLLDVQLVYALQLDGRAPFNLIGEVLVVTDQTIARRYNRLRSSGLLRVRGLVEPDLLGLRSWLIRVQCTPSAAAAVAEALARRPDTAWISLTSGGPEIACVVRTQSGDDGSHLLLDTLPRSRGVTGITAQCVLHTYFGGVLSLVNKSGTLTPDQVAELQPAGETRAGPPAPVTAGDETLLTALELDGRTTYRDLATTTGWSQSTARRRPADPPGSGPVCFG